MKLAVAGAGGYWGPNWVRVLKQLGALAAVCHHATKALDLPGQPQLLRHHVARAHGEEGQRAIDPEAVDDLVERPVAPDDDHQVVVRGEFACDRFRVAARPGRLDGRREADGAQAFLEARQAAPRRAASR